MILINLEKATLADINLIDLLQTPDQAIRYFWYGSDEELQQYFKKHGISIDWDVPNIEALKQRSDMFMQKIADAVKKDLSKFDFRLRNTLIKRNLAPLSEEDFMKISFDLSGLSDAQKEKIKKSVFMLQSNTLIDFREIKDDNLVIVANRKGMYDEGERIALVKAKQSITLKENFKHAKDSNFVMAGLVTALARIDQTIDFVHKYKTADNVEKEFRASGSEVLKIEDQKDAKAREEIREAQAKAIAKAELENEKKGEPAQTITPAAEQVKAVAKEELKKEAAKNRDSLTNDSTVEQLNKEGSTQIKIAPVVEDAAPVSLDAIAEETESLYIDKEIEKMKQRLAKAQKDAPGIYKEMRQRIAAGDGVLDVINVAKQKYREEHAVNLASIYLTRDLQEIEVKEKEIAKLGATIDSKNQAIAEKEDAITKREATITSLRSTMAEKENERRLLVERYEAQLEELAKQSKDTLESVSGNYEDALRKKEEEIIKADALIEKLADDNRVVKAESSAKDETIAALKASVERMEKQLEKMDAANQSKDEKIKQTEIEAKEERKSFKEQLEKLTTEFKSMLEERAGTIDAQKKEIRQLRADVAEFRAKLKESADYIAQLENEIEKTQTVEEETEQKTSSVKERAEEMKDRLQNTTKAETEDGGAVKDYGDTDENKMSLADRFKERTGHGKKRK